MNLVQEAARIAEARFAALALSVYGNEAITGDLSWKNNALTPGSMFLVGYIFGHHNPATKGFSPLQYKIDAVAFSWGSAIQSAAPAQGSSKSESISSYAPNIVEAVTLDVVCFLSSGTLGIAYRLGAKGYRVGGLNWDDYQKLDFRALRVFEDVVSVVPKRVTFTLYGFNYPSGINQEQIWVSDGPQQTSGRQAPGTRVTFSIQGDSVNFEWGLWGPAYPDGISAFSGLGGIADGATIPMDITQLLHL